MNKLQNVRYKSKTAINEQKISSQLKDFDDDASNPNSDLINIEFELNSSGNIRILIFDHIANLIKIIELFDCQTGKNSYTWNCKNNLDMPVNRGLYYYEVRYNNHIQTRRMIII